MTYNAPTPIGPDNEQWPGQLDAKRAFVEAGTALTDSALSLESAVDAVENIDVETLLRVFKERRMKAKRELVDVGLTNGFRIDGVDPTKTEELRRTWMTLKAKVADDQAVIATLTAGERDAIERLEAATDRGLPAEVESILGSAIDEILNNLELLDAETLNQS